MHNPPKPLAAAKQNLIHCSIHCSDRKSDKYGLAGFPRREDAGKKKEEREGFLMKVVGGETKGKKEHNPKGDDQFYTLPCIFQIYHQLRPAQNPLLSDTANMLTCLESCRIPSRILSPSAQIQRRGRVDRTVKKPVRGVPNQRVEDELYAVWSKKRQRMPGPMLLLPEIREFCFVVPNAFVLDFSAGKPFPIIYTPWSENKTKTCSLAVCRVVTVLLIGEEDNNLSISDVIEEGDQCVGVGIREKSAGC
jgi:hypothetical protein